MCIRDRGETIVQTGAAAEHTNAMADACGSGDVELVCILLKQCATTELIDELGCSPLIHAARAASPGCVRVLMLAGANAHHLDTFGWSALSYACAGGFLGCVRELIAGRADVDWAAACGVTPLMTACLYSHVDCAHALLEARADVHRSTPSGSSPITRSTSLEAMQLLCACGADREALFANPLVFSRLVPEVQDWIIATREWTTPLHHVQLLTAPRVRELLAAGADVHARSGRQGSQTPLTIATSLLESGAQHVGAAMIVAAAGPWSSGVPALFPPWARARAVQLLLIGYGISNVYDCALLDVWIETLMPFAVRRNEDTTCSAEGACSHVGCHRPGVGVGAA